MTSPPATGQMPPLTSLFLALSATIVIAQLSDGRRSSRIGGGFMEPTNQSPTVEEELAPQEPVHAEPIHDGLEDELLTESLIEEVSIDGMCGVY